MIPVYFALFAFVFLLFSLQYAEFSSDFLCTDFLCTCLPSFVISSFLLFVSDLFFICVQKLVAVVAARNLVAGLDITALTKCQSLGWFYNPNQTQLVHEFFPWVNQQLASQLARVGQADHLLQGLCPFIFWHGVC